MSIDALVKDLTNKGLIIEDVNRVTRYLSHIGYYRLGSYASHFQTNKVFNNNITFDDILNLYIFDRKLRILLLEAIERIEVAMRANVADILALEHNDLYFYNKQDIFANEISYQRFMDKVADSLRNIDNSNNIKQQKQFSHNGNNYKLPPSWELFHLMTFKQLSVFVASIKGRNAKLVANKFHLKSSKVFVSWLHSMSDLRNICAHHSRVWNRLFGTQPMIPQLDMHLIVKVPYELTIEGKSTKIKPHRKLYFQIVVLWFFLKQTSPHSSWANRLKELMQEYHIDSREMGFPENWFEDKFWNV